jgi:hypothetical protein
VRLAGVVAEHNSDTGIVFAAANALITGSRFLDNQDGIQFGATDPNGEFVLRCNDVAENENDGLIVGGANKVNAEQNYWGSPTGPTNPSNPGGTGDSIVSAPGVVDFQPFLTVSSAAPGTCHPAGVPALDKVGLALLLIALSGIAAMRLSRQSMS